jgi:hypothetical protein
MGCPTVPYGIPKDGAPEYNVNSGRELFRCGMGNNGCIKLYITNVSVENSTVKYGCRTGNSVGSDYCIENVNYNERVRKQVQWVAKDGVNSSLPNGTVITRVGECDGGEGIIPLYTEATVRVRVLMDITQLTPNSAQSIIDDALNNVSNNISGDWVLQDLGTSASPTDWQTANITFMAMSNVIPSYDSYRESINLTNGRVQYATGHVRYDDTNDPVDLASIVSQLLR